MRYNPRSVRTTKRWTVALMGAAVLAVGLAGCLRLKPYQRETHARKSMQDQGAVDKKLDEHVHEYREGSVGGSGVGGGGCGCN